MSIYEKAQELGYALLNCNETTVLRAAETNLDNDVKAQTLIKEFRQRQEKINNLQEAGIEISNDEWIQFTQIQEKIKENKVIQAYFAAQTNFRKVLQEVNTIINQVLLGGSCSPLACSECNSSDCK